MKSFKDRMMLFLMVWALAILLLSGTVSYATEIAGNWLAEDQAGNSVFIDFGSEYAFYIEDETSWIQGTYTIRSGTIPRQLDLYIEDGSNLDDVGKKAKYFYEIQEKALILSGETDHPTILDTENTAGRYVYIGINLDSSDEDDDDDDSNFSVYASCFVTGVISD